MSEPKFVKPDVPKDPGLIHTRSIVSHRTGRGAVVIEWNDEAGQFDPEDARRFALTILRECDNAETDAFLYSFMKDKVQAEPWVLAGIITDYRKYRAQLEQLAGLRPGQPVPEDDAR